MRADEHDESPDAQQPRTRDGRDLPAQRLATIRHCDTIFLLDGGHLVAQGGYDELLAQSLLFRRMASDRTEQGAAVAHAG